MDEKLKWFVAGKYGLFIHFGLYSKLGGEWKGTRTTNISEWIMRDLRIPYMEYMDLMSDFNPTSFDARKWVDYAVSFGCKYLCITAKHHDGFALFDSKVSDYTIMQTPFKRDIIKELSEACAEKNIVFCVYYSQFQDWSDPDANGNDWDFNEDQKVFNNYFERKVKPQITELLTNYGKIGMIWFDTPRAIDRVYCEELADLVHSLQPECLINGRIGYGLGDFGEMDDNEFPVRPCTGPWELPMTLNNTWGFSKYDSNWKSPAKLIRTIVSVVGRGGNVLCNIGPDGNGVVPARSVEILQAVGDWLKRNGESIYGEENQIDYSFQIRWGGLTCKGNKLYMHVIDTTEYPNRIPLIELDSEVKRCYMLETGQELEYIRRYDQAEDMKRFSVRPIIDLDSPDNVIVVQFDEKPVFKKSRFNMLWN